MHFWFIFIFLAGFAAGALFWDPLLTRLVRFKQGIVKLLISLRIINPGRRERHAWVGGAAYAEMKRQFQIDFLKQRGLQPSHFLWDIGCGTLRGGIPLIRYLDAGCYAGSDVRPRVLQEAQKELTDCQLAHKKPLLFVQSEAASTLQKRRFDVIWVFNVFIHMNDDILQETVQIIANHLQPRGTCYGSVRVGAREDSHWQGFPAVVRPLYFYEDAVRACGLKMNVLGTLDSLGYGTQHGERSDLLMLALKH